MQHIIGSVDPYRLDQYRHCTAARQEALLYCLSSPGRTAWVQARNLWLFLRMYPAGNDGTHMPYESVVAAMPDMHKAMQRCGFGNRSQLMRSWWHAVSHVDVDKPEHLTVANLVKIPYCSSKTARLVVENLVPECDRVPEDRRIAILDTHVLGWLREHGHPYAPRTSPQTEGEYRRWEGAWLELRDAGVADRDLELWKSLARRPPDDWKTRPIVRGSAAGEKPMTYGPDGKPVA